MVWEKVAGIPTKSDTYGRYASTRSEDFGVHVPMINLNAAVFPNGTSNGILPEIRSCFGFEGEIEPKCMNEP